MEYIKYLFSRKDSDYTWMEVILCRLRNHPAGVIWHNLNGLEPDMTCKGCGDNLG